MDIFGLRMNLVGKRNLEQRACALLKPLWLPALLIRLSETYIAFVNIYKCKHFQNEKNPGSSVFITNFY